MKACKYCDGGDSYKTKKFNIGILGQLEMDVWVIPNGSLDVDMEIRGNSGISYGYFLESNIKIKYCPYCGRKLGEEKKGKTK